MRCVVDLRHQLRSTRRMAGRQVDESDALIPELRDCLLSQEEVLAAALDDANVRFEEVAAIA